MACMPACQPAPRGRRSAARASVSVPPCLKYGRAVPASVHATEHDQTKGGRRGFLAIADPSLPPFLPQPFSILPPSLTLSSAMPCSSPARPLTPLPPLAPVKRTCVAHIGQSLEASCRPGVLGFGFARVCVCLCPTSRSAFPCVVVTWRERVCVRLSKYRRRLYPRGGGRERLREGLQPARHSAMMRGTRQKKGDRRGCVRGEPRAA